MSQNYKDTLNLPRTELFDESEPPREAELLKTWRDKRLHHQIQKSRKPPSFFCPRSEEAHLPPVPKE
jgi:isoleucyl-tRNA synthetase